MCHCRFILLFQHGDNYAFNIPLGCRDKCQQKRRIVTTSAQLVANGKSRNYYQSMGIIELVINGLCVNIHDMIIKYGCSTAQAPFEHSGCFDSDGTKLPEGLFEIVNYCYCQNCKKAAARAALVVFCLYL